MSPTGLSDTPEDEAEPPAPDLRGRMSTSYPKTSVPSAAELHLMNRMGCGYSRATFTQLRQMGGAATWFEGQLNPASVPESATANALPGWYPDLQETPTRKFERDRAGGKGSWEYARDLGNYTMLRRVYSHRQVLEAMVDLWSNHLHVPANGHLGWTHRYHYDLALRKHALGRFDELLTAATLHPAMLLYLDNWRSTRNAPNENHGRELLELHTVGRTSGYTEQMVKDSAKILSGYTVDAKNTWVGLYDESLHTTGPVEVLGFTADNAAADGSQLARDYLRHLAHHPATARTVARKLATRFVSDTPSDALVTHLARVYLDSGTDIRATLRALVASTEFKGSARKKVRTPVEDFVATCRVLQVQARRPTRSTSFGTAIAWLHQSMLLFQWPRPDGPPDHGPAWASASRMLSSFRMHWLLAGGYYPDVDVTYRTPRSWLPQKRVRLDRYVDHMCRMLLGRGATARDLTAVLQATGRKPGEVVTTKHPLASYLFVRMVAALLDSPTHMSR